MRTALALALILGCSPTAPTDDSADAAPDAATAVVAADAGTPDAGPDRCGFGRINCGGTCIALDGTNCGTCGRTCPRGYGCCYHANDVWCSTSLNCER